MFQFQLLLRLLFSSLTLQNSDFALLTVKRRLKELYLDYGLNIAHGNIMYVTSDGETAYDIEHAKTRKKLHICDVGDPTDYKINIDGVLYDLRHHQVCGIRQIRSDILDVREPEYIFVDLLLIDNIVYLESMSVNKSGDRNKNLVYFNDGTKYHTLTVADMFLKKDISIDYLYVVLDDQTPSVDTAMPLKQWQKKVLKDFLDLFKHLRTQEQEQEQKQQEQAKDLCIRLAKDAWSQKFSKMFPNILLENKEEWQELFSQEEVAKPVDYVNFHRKRWLSLSTGIHPDRSSKHENLHGFPNECRGNQDMMKYYLTALFQEYSNAKDKAEAAAEKAASSD